MINNYKGRIGIKHIIILIAIIAIIAIIGVVFFMKGPTPNVEPPVQGGEENVGGTSHQHLNNNSATNNDTPTNNGNSNGQYHGYWVDLVMGGSENSGDDLWIYENNDGTIDFEYIGNNGISFEAKNVPTNSEAVDFTDNSLNYKGKLYIRPKSIELEYGTYDSDARSSVTFEKHSKKTLSRTQLFYEIQKVINNKYQDIDSSIFRIKDGKEFLLLNIVPTCYIEKRELKSSYDGIDYFREVYTIDKFKNKLVSISDVIEDEEHARAVDAYIKDFIAKRQTQAEKSGDEWPYYNEEFIGVLSPYNTYSKYFYVDETNYVVSINVFGDLWCNVPFYVVFGEDRLNRYGIEVPVIEEQVSGEMVSGEENFESGGIENVTND